MGTFISTDSPTSTPRGNRRFSRRRPLDRRLSTPSTPSTLTNMPLALTASLEKGRSEFFVSSHARNNRSARPSSSDRLTSILFERDKKFVSPRVSQAGGASHHGSRPIAKEANIVRQDVSVSRHGAPLTPRRFDASVSDVSSEGSRRRSPNQARTNTSSAHRASRSGSNASARRFRASIPREPRQVPADFLSAKDLPTEKKLRIIPIGGQEEVGRNMTIFEYENDIVIIDMGVQWPEADMPGIDYIVPNVSYLKGKEHNIRGVIFTHGHLDHIGAAPILLKDLNYPPIIGRDLTIAMIKHKVDDHDKGAASRLKVIPVRTLDDVVRLGAFRAKFFEVEHSIMDAIGIILETPEGTVIHMGDWTISNEPIDPRPITYTNLADLPKPTILMLESLGALKKGDPPSEREVHQNLRDLLESAPGRVILATFSSQVRRIAYIIEYAENLGKKVALEGYSMKMNMEIAKELGYLKAKKDTIIAVNDIHKYADNQIVVICTGAQGELNAALSKIVTDNHRFIKLQKRDTIVFSSSVIPGNERTIQRLKDNLYRKCDNVIHSDIIDIHIGGHSTASGIAEMLRQVRPTYFLPVYANHYFLKEAAKIGKKSGMLDDHIFVLDNGSVLEFSEKSARMLPKKVDSSYVFIDGLGVGDIGHVVLRDRQMLSQDGMIVITAIIDSKSKKIVGSVQITSRGFIHVKENFDLVNEVKRKVIKIVKDSTSVDTSIDWNLVRGTIRDEIGQFLFTKTERRPMVLPVVVEV